MAIQIGKHNFDGPHGNTGAIHATSGVYVILGKSGGTHWSVVDVGESVSVPEPQRMLIERELRASFNPPCGDR